MKTTCLALLAAAVLLAAGCGGDDKTSSSSGARGYAETGQAITDICKRAEAAANTIGKDANGDAKHDAPLVQKLADSNQSYVDELKQIKPDPKLQSTFDAYVTQIESVQAKVKETLKIAQSGDSEAYRMAIEAVNAEDPATHKLERALGAPGCITKS